MATPAPMTPQTSSTARCGQSKPVCWANRWCCFGVADQRGDRDTERAETRGTEYQRHQDGGPVRGHRHAIESADADDQCDLEDADHRAMREQLDEVDRRRDRKSVV